MSFCYDTMERAWATLRQQLPPKVREGELAMRFEFLLLEMHEANHRLKDAINHDERVTRAARRLDDVQPRQRIGIYDALDEQEKRNETDVE